MYLFWKTNRAAYARPQGQVWFVQPFLSSWTISVGEGSPTPPATGVSNIGFGLISNYAQVTSGLAANIQATATGVTGDGLVVIRSS